MSQIVDNAMDEKAATPSPMEAGGHVRKSVRGMVWRLRSTDAPLPSVLPPAVHPAAARIAHRRNVSDLDKFFEPTLEQNLPASGCLAGLKEAAEAVVRAFRRGDTVGILSDYDVDGATSAALILRWISNLGGSAIFHIPQRLTEGYGANIPAIESLYERGARLLLITDSGTTAIAPVARARELGMEVVILDHHEPSESGVYPDAILVNPKLPANAPAGLDYLCTAGLAYLFLIEANKHLQETGFLAEALPDISQWLGLVALGTVADVVPLIGLNRAYVVNGLGAMGNIAGIAGLRRALGEAGERGDGPEYSVYSCGFSYGPCINAAGRISDTRLGTRLLIADDWETIMPLARTLVSLNEERREMQRVAVDECIAAFDGGAAAVIYDEGYHPGIVGLCASRLKDHYDVSAVVIGADGKGSGRSVDGFHIGKAFMRAVELGLLKKGGGHGAAGGLTIDPNKVDEFREFMLQEAQKAPPPILWVDEVFAVSDISVDLVTAMGALGPFGAGNPRPHVLLRGVCAKKMRALKGRHIKATLFDGADSVSMILFNGVGSRLGENIIVAQGEKIDLVGELSINEYNGKKEVQFRPVDMLRDDG